MLLLGVERDFERDRLARGVPRIAPPLEVVPFFLHEHVWRQVPALRPAHLSTPEEERRAVLFLAELNQFARYLLLCRAQGSDLFFQICDPRL
jgi:hypothetical protein